jgi:hypothetical protein
MTLQADSPIMIDFYRIFYFRNEDYVRVIKPTKKYKMTTASST